MSCIRLTQEKFIEKVENQYPGEYTILSSYTTSREKVLIKHNICGYEWKVNPWNLIQGKIKKCPLCSNKWKRTTEDFKQEVKTLYGKEYLVIGKYKSTNTPLLMLHTTCGHTFMRMPRELKNGILCPHCRRPNYYENTESFNIRMYEKYKNKYSLMSEYKSAREKISVLCNKCGNVWDATPDNLMHGHGCPKCTLSHGEDRIDAWLLQNGFNFKRQYCDKRCKDIRALRFDFAVFDSNEKIILLIEYDGKQHSKPTRFKSNMSNEVCEKNLADVQKKDSIKNDFCRREKINLLRINYKEFNDIEKILEKVLRKTIPC